LGTFTPLDSSKGMNNNKNKGNIMNKKEIINLLKSKLKSLEEIHWSRQDTLENWELYKDNPTSRKVFGFTKKETKQASITTFSKICLIEDLLEEIENNKEGV